jgi:hypothetical protein
MSDLPDPPYSMGCRVVPTTCSLCEREVTPGKEELHRSLCELTASLLTGMLNRPSYARQIFPVTELPPEELVDLEGVHEDV